MHKNIKDIINQRFGMLTVLSLAEKRSPRRDTMWHCKCDCGNEIDVRSASLKSGNTKSCGCLKKEQGVKMKDLVCINDTNIGIIMKNETKAQKNSKTGVRGVCMMKTGKYITYIGFQKKRYFLGIFETAEDAGRAYKKARENLYGDFLSWYNEQKSNNFKEKQNEG